MHNKNTLSDIKIKKQNEWGEQSEILRKIVKSGAQQFFSEIKNLDRAFSTPKNRFVCMDEGTAHQCRNAVNFGLAGSGILYPGNWPDRIKKICDLMMAVGINEITSHDGCGAAGIAFKQAPKEFLKRNQIDNTDDFAFYWAAELSKAMHKRCSGQVCHKHINAASLVRPIEFHNASCAWFNFTENFDPSHLGNKVPKGFLNEPGLLEKYDAQVGKNYALRELSLAIQIAFGDHGFGKEFFNKNTPFLIIIVSNNKEKITEKVKEVSEFLSKDKKLIELLGKPLDYLFIDGFAKS